MSEHEEHIFLVVKEGCPVCKEAEEELKDLFEEHKMEPVDVNSEKFNEIKQKIEIKRVPTCIIEVKNGDDVQYEYCSEKEKEKQSA